MFLYRTEKNTLILLAEGLYVKSASTFRDLLLPYGNKILSRSSLIKVWRIGEIFIIEILNK